MPETLLSTSEVLLFGRLVEDLKVVHAAGSPGQGKGKNRHLEAQLKDNEAQFARIYGFSYEGTYHELPEPVLFLVHGDGAEVTPNNNPPENASRAPTDPSMTGVAAADFQFANDIKCWPYDKADYTIRMDVTTGMFEQVLLDVHFGHAAPGLAGGKVSGGKVSGGKVSGGKVSGGKVSGGKAWGPGD